jgi:hypothetical protein
MDLLPLCQNCISQIDRFSSLQTILNFQIKVSLDRSKTDTESFSFKTEPWFEWVTSVINKVTGKVNECLWEEELFYVCLESLVNVKSSVTNSWALNKLVNKQVEDSVFDSADERYMLESWLKLVFDFLEK